MIYLASPYSHPSATVREERFIAACKKAAELMRDGKQVYSPIAHTHSIALAGELPLGWDYWERYDRWYIERCSEVNVLMLSGWHESKGVSAEIKIANEIGKPVSYIMP